MGKIISIKHASKDDPIFTGRHKVLNSKAPIQKSIKVKKEKP